MAYSYVAKNAMEPIMFTLNPSMTYSDLPHEGEEFGYVLDGEIIVGVGKESIRLKAARVSLSQR